MTLLSCSRDLEVTLRWMKALGCRGDVAQDDNAVDGLRSTSNTVYC